MGKELLVKQTLYAEKHNRKPHPSFPPFTIFATKAAPIRAVAAEITVKSQRQGLSMVDTD